jgi:exonuclease III
MDDLINDLIDLGDNHQFVCQSLLEEDFDAFLNTDIVASVNAAFNILHVNVRSMNANYDSFQSLILNRNISAIAITESWLNNSNQNLYNLPGYNFYNLNRISVHPSGGVAWYIDSLICSSVCPELCVSDPNIECLFINASITVSPNCSFKFILGCIYRPPNGCCSMFFESLQSILISLDKPCYRNYTIIITGDFNINLLNVDLCHQATQFANLMMSYSLFSTIDKPTRVTPTNGYFN